jgi:hypothetical protein
MARFSISPGPGAGKVEINPSFGSYGVGHVHRPGWWKGDGARLPFQAAKVARNCPIMTCCTEST